LYAYDPLHQPPRAVPFAIIPGSHRAYGIGPGNKHTALYEIDLSQAAADRLIYEAPDADVLEPAMAANGAVLGVKLDTERPRVHYLHRREASLIEGIDQLFTDTFNEIVDVTPDKKVYVIRATSDVDAGTYYLLDASKPHADLQLIGRTRTDLDPAQLVRVRVITITLESGQSTRAFLSRPATQIPSALPLIVLPDDGPNGRTEWRFSFLRHFLLSRGYAVLQLQLDDTASASNYFAVRHDLDGLAYAFVRQGARWAIDQGVADANRIALMGWGFGGYLAMIGSQRDPELFRCAVGVNAVTDLREQPGNHAVQRFIGNVASALSRSVRSYDEHRSPILLVHGSHDTVVHPHHSIRMSLPLHDSGTRNQRIEISEGSHDLIHPHHRTQMLDAVETFLAQHLSPAK
jgi:dipeptidyl aminopeptidase/acylaminoacyl peptidase